VTAWLTDTQELDLKTHWKLQTHIYDKQAPKAYRTACPHRFWIIAWQ
jgi:hypothetical protein